MESQARLKGLFRELFQLDVADLDFGLYRLFHLKRTEVETFLDKQLPAEIDRAFEAAAGAEREALQKRVNDLAERARESVADDAILPSGEPNPIHAKAKAVKDYAEARARLMAVEVSEAQQAEIFNLLYAFFSRYYDDGDFIPRRFYGARASYAVPYNGEEVFFHWANKDQYYVKSGEAFRDYAFTVSAVSGSYSVRFRLVEATASKDNTKGETRFFFPLPKETTFEEAAHTLTVPFHYRLPTEGEAAKYGKNAKAQEPILDEVAPRLLKSVSDDFLRGALSAPSPSGRETEGEEPPTLLRRRLTHFTKKNTSDYFVHKNLGAFLRQELEFFVRDQVVHEADLEGEFEAKRRTIRVFRKLAESVITFIAQVEDAQKRLFEKKKFVLRTDYFLPIQCVPRALWPEVLANKAQLAEWKEQFALSPKSDIYNIKGKINDQVLENIPTLVVDTRHFSPDFIGRLLETIGDLDEQTDGVLIHGENFQALSLMRARYQEEVECIHIDPPYNTQTSGFMYRNNYQHSSWLAMMSNRLNAGQLLMTTKGSLLCHIDENEHERLQLLCDGIQLTNGGTIVWDKKNPMLGRKGVATQHEYVLWRTAIQGPVYIRNANQRLILGTARKIIETNGEVTDAAREEFAQWISKCPGLSGGERANRYIDDDGRIYQSAGMAAPELRTDPKFFVPLIHPRTGKPCPVPPYGWSRAPETLQELISRNEIIFGKDESVQPRRKVFLTKDSQRQVSSVIQDAGRGKTDMDKLGLSFPYCHPLSLYVELIGAAAPASDAIVLDYFAGSGTNGHAVVALNRDEDTHRKFILVEVADYFDTVLVPRLKKVMLTPEWKSGKPERVATKQEAERTPRLVKILRLESYEDALHNTFSDEAIERLTKREKAYRDAVGDDEYRIRYLVKLPLESSDAMLNLAKLEHPFDYTLEVLTDHGPKTETVDLLETFNWLYGLRVHRLLTWVNNKDKAGKEKDGRSYRAIVGSDREGKKRVLVVWRDMASLDPKVERPFLEAQAMEAGAFDEQWINGDTSAKAFASLDGLFKRLMEEGER